MNFQTICRICISENSEMVSIFESHDFSIVHNFEIFKVIKDCASVQIQELDGFSKKICMSCLEHLSQAYSFKKLCEDSDYKFRNNLIESNEIYIKSEFTEEGAINFKEIHYDNIENTQETDILTNCRLPEVKQEHCDDKIITENKSEEDQDEANEELDASLSDDVFQHIDNAGPSHLNNQKKSYTCDFCEKKFTSNSYLAAHSRIHTGEKPYNCEFCEKKFAFSANLARHIRLHTGEKPYQCEFCDRKFVSSSHLSQHVKIHTGNRPFKCEICGKDFTQSSTLESHIRMHTGDKRFKCDICELKFTQKGNLTEHIRVHTGEKPYKCDFCEHKCRSSSRLVDHMRKHTGEKPYNCDFCEKTFALKITLARHVRTHTGEKPYKCDFCERYFSARNSLLRHIKNKHKE